MAQSTAGHQRLVQPGHWVLFAWNRRVFFPERLTRQRTNVSARLSSIIRKSQKSAALQLANSGHTHWRWSARYQMPFDRAMDADGCGTRRPADRTTRENKTLRLATLLHVAEIHPQQFDDKEYFAKIPMLYIKMNLFGHCNRHRYSR